MSLRLQKRKNSPYWKITGTRYGQKVRKTTQESCRKEAAEVLLNLENKLREQFLYGQPERVKWVDAVVKYFETVSKKSIGDDLIHVRKLDPFLKNLFLDEINDDTLSSFIQHRKKEGVKHRTINASLQVVRRILTLSARKWKYIQSVPLLEFLAETDRRDPYPMSWDEQIRLFNELPGHLRDMALFKVNTGCREAEVCNLQWKWLHNSSGISYFEIPREMVKNGLPRVVVLNAVALTVVNRNKGFNLKYVFTYKGKPIQKMNDSAWKSARKRCGLEGVRIHDLKHTLGARLRACGVPEEDRKFLLGHKSGMSMTTHYSVPELRLMQEYLNRVCEPNDNLVLLKRANGS